MGRRIAWFLIAALSLGGAGLAVYRIYFSTLEVVSVPEPDSPSVGKAMPSPDEFARLAQSDAVGTFEACLQRYERDGIKAFTATLEKQERIQGDLHEREIVQLSVADEVPAHSGEHPNIRVRMVWESGFQKLLTVKTLGTLYPNPNTDNRKEMTAYTSWGIAKTVEVKDMMARGASRYCICDAGLYRGMLRTYDAWKKRQSSGQLHAHYLGLQTIEKVGNRPCYVIRRTAASPEVDPFALDEAPNPKANASRDGATEITAYIDAERWLHVGTVLKRADGSLLAEYYFRDIVLSKSELQPNPFTLDALKAATKK